MKLPAIEEEEGFGPPPHPISQDDDLEQDIELHDRPQEKPPRPDLRKLKVPNQPNDFPDPLEDDKDLGG